MITPRLEVRDLRATERMEDPDCDQEMLERTYARFRIVNALVAGWRTTYRRHVRPLLRRGVTTTALDIGSGGGDVTRALTRWARRDGFRLQITGIDPDPRAYAWALHRPPRPGLSFRRALSSDLVADGSRFDLVVSNHLLHHLDEAQFEGLLDDSRRLARRRVIHSDISRSRLAHALFSAGAWPLSPGSFIREDGLISIRRSYTAHELRDGCPAGWRVETVGPWRNLLLHEPGDA